MFFKCLAALFYDACLLIALFFVFTACCLLAYHGQAIPVGTRWYQLCLILIGLSYYIFSIGKGGQTLGMRAWRLRLVAADEGVPTFQQASRRIVLTLPALIIALISLQNPQRLLSQWTKTVMAQAPHAGFGTNR